MNQVEKTENPALTKILDEVNRWLKNKWLMAEFVQVLPDASAAYDQFTKDFWRNFSSAYPWKDIVRAAVQRAVDQHGPAIHEKFSLDPEENKGDLAARQYWNSLFLFDLKREDKYIVLFSWLDPEKEILRLELEMHTLGDPNDKDQDYKENAVRQIAWISGQMPDENMLTGLADRAIVLDFEERWRLASVEFQKKHSICPVCGCHVSLDRCGDGYNFSYRYTCDSCGWVMNHKFRYVDELESSFCEKLFRMERKKAEKEIKKEKNKRNNLNQARAAMEALSKIFPEKKFEDRQKIRRALLEMIDQYFPDRK